jgi:hypothetical protein
MEINERIHAELQSRGIVSREEHIVPASSGGLNYPRDRPDDALELRHFKRQLFASSFGELVVARAAVAGRGAPLCGDPPFDEHALERRIERAFFHLQRVVGGVLDRVGNLIPVQFALPRKGFQDQQTKRSRGNLVTIHSRLT